MPYSKAYYFLIGLFIVTLMAFWPSYFGKLLDASMAHHLHGITATLWLLLIATQSWLIHHGHANLHRKLGLLIFILVPLMMGAFALVTWIGANKSVGLHPFYVEIGQSLLVFDVLLLFTTALQIYWALSYRKNVRLHSALLLGTLAGLAPPILSRLFNQYVPGLSIDGLDTMYKFEYSIQLSILVGVALSLLLFVRHRKDGWPWLFAAGIIACGYILHTTIGKTAAWQNTVDSVAKLNPLVVYGFGFILGLMACIMGWLNKKQFNI